ncbi:MAG: sigma-70 family RNA polymerase sigma factor, partial [Sedimentisphaerales bacterium]|nr:sigma-70 family RNA polymerase sigma factor [Sedimentisphaerales bacterium]
CTRLRRSASAGRAVLEAKAIEPGPRDRIAQGETRQSLWAAARTLSPIQYEALWLRYAEDMPIKEIAKVMGNSQVSVKVALCRARMRLAEKLQDMAAARKGGGKASLKETLALMKVEGV